MRVAGLIDRLRGYPQDLEVELAVPFEEDGGLEVDHYSIALVVPWEDEEEEGLTRLWLVGGEDDNVDAFVDSLESDDG
jgi:hypothetical protein